MAVHPTIEEAKRDLVNELAAVAGDDGARRLASAVDRLIAAAGGPDVTALCERNRMLEALLDALPDRVAMYALGTTQLVFGNRAVTQSFGELSNLPPEEMFGRTIAQLNLPAEVVRDNGWRFARVAAGETLRHEVLMPTADSLRWRETLMSPVRDAAGAVESVAVSSRDIHERKLAESRLRLLSKLTRLADAIDHEGVYAALAHMTVPELGDWCLVDTVSDGKLGRVQVAHRDPAQASLADELARAPDSPALASSLRQLVANGSFVLPRVQLDKPLDDAQLDKPIDDAQVDKLLDDTKVDKQLDDTQVDKQLDDVQVDKLLDHPELRALLTRLSARSLLLLPLVLDGELAAVATLVWSGESPWQYGPDDRAIAEAIAGRATQTLENARLHQQLRESEERFRVALAHSQVSLFEVDRELRFRWAQLPIAMEPLPDIVGRALGEVSDQSEAFTAILQQAIDSGRGVTSEVEVGKDGELRCLLASIEPLRDEAGVVTGAIGAATDITDTKRVQEELARALGFRDQMLGILGHDLRNPLSAVTGLTGLMLLDSALSNSARGQVEHIQEAARRMSEMIRTLIDFAQSRFKQGGLPVTPSRCDLGAIAAAAVADLRAAHHASVIELAAPAAADGHWDAGRMAQVVSNLVANAIAHGDRASPVRVALEVADDHVVLRVSNRGPMIPRELLPTLFEPFRQGNGATRSRGLGLGLYIVDQIVRGHGGTIAVDSTADGTTFSVRVPR